MFYFSHNYIASETNISISWFRTLYLQKRK